jgi:hypothetical protein
MKNILAATIFASTAALPLFAEEAKQPLIVEAPATWKVEFDGGGESIKIYTVTRKEDDAALLVFSRSSDPGYLPPVREVMDNIAKRFVGMAKDKKDIQLNTGTYNIEVISGQEFSVHFVQFEAEGGMTQTLFVIRGVEGTWTGQFTGTKERWSEALMILKSVKKNG